MTVQQDKPKRWQFGLRSLFFVMLLIAIPLAMLVQFFRAWQQALIDARNQGEQRAAEISASPQD